MILAGFISAATIIQPTLKKKIVKTEKGKQPGFANMILLLFYYLIYSTLHVMSMILIMTYNGGILLSMMLCMTVSYFLFGAEDKDSDMPINCCATHA